jgi:hypothetical protein
MILMSVLLATVIFFGSLAVAEAQTYVQGGQATPQTTLGWNFTYISQCVTFHEGQNTWLMAHGQGGGHAFTNNPALVSAVAPACQSGNLVAIHVVSINPFIWDLVVLYPFK